MRQLDLADAAGVSVFTISRAEQSKHCPLKPSTAQDVLRALHRRMEIPLPQVMDFLSMVRLDSLKNAVKTVGPDEALGINRAAERGGAPAKSPTLTPDETSAFDALKHLMDERGVGTVYTALEGLAAAWNVNLPPLRKPNDAKPLWALLTRETFENLNVTVYTPTRSAQPPKQQPKQRKAE